MSSRSVLRTRRWLRLALVPSLFGIVLVVLLSLLSASAAQGPEPAAPGTDEPPPVASLSPDAALPGQPLQAARAAALPGAPPDAVRGRPDALGQQALARANTDWDSVDGQFGYPVSVQYTVTTGQGDLKGTGQGATKSNGWMNGVGCNCDIAPGDRVHVRSSAGFDAVLFPIPIEGQIDVAADRVSGKMYKANFPASGGVRIWSQARDESAWQPISIAADGSYTADFAGKFDVRLGDEAEVWYFDANGNWVGAMLYTPRVEAELWFNPGGHSNMWGRAEPGAALTVTTAYAEVHAVAGEDRRWDAPDIGPLQPGDGITVEVAGLPPVLMPVPKPWDAQADSATDRVWGQVGGRFNKPVEVHGQWDGGYQEVNTDAAGHFTATYGDVPRGAQGYIRWTSDLAEYAGAVYHRPFQATDLTVRVDYYHDDVYGYYPAGHTVWVTVTDSSAAVRATASATTGPMPWDASQIGFAVQPDDWAPGRPDVVPGDWVHASADDGRSTTVHVGAITGQVDAGSNSVSGHVYASWFTQTLGVDCHPWQGAPGGAPSKQSTAGPNGDPPYLCQWNPASEWDILPGQFVGVWYIGPDANWVANGFSEPAPDLHVETWPAGGGEAAAGGQAVFQVRYQNLGDVAGDAVLTDTLPAGATYVADSSGLPAVLAGNKVIWNVGAVQPMTVPVQFQLVVRNSSAVSETLHNVVDIAAQYDANWGDNHAEAQVHVGGGSPDLYVNADAQPGDPTPGQRFRYAIHFGNNGPVASGRACLTETLPLQTTFISLEPEQNYRLWKLESHTGRQWVFCAPSVQGQWGGQLFLNLRLDAGVPYNSQLVNRVEIGTKGDNDLGNNVHVNDGTYAKPLRFDPAAIKWWWAGGSLAIGREAEYGIEYRNGGNNQMHGVVMTDTLPAGTTFVASELDPGWGIRVPFPPTRVAGSQLVWELGAVEVNAAQQIVVRLRINPGTAPGAALTNCVEVGSSDFDENPYNNRACDSQTAQPAGPNLRVTVLPGWEGQNRLRYDVRAENVGTTTEHNVTVTDTFPAALTLNAWQVDWGQGWQWQLDGNRFAATFDRLEPGAAPWLHLWLDVPAVPNGSHFTGTAEITTPPGDVNPADNQDSVVEGTGPDLRLQKWQSGGPSRPEPHDVFTYTLHLENHSQAWSTQGNVCITDTLPTGVEFVKLLRRRCWPDFCQESPQVSGDGVVSWCISPWGGGNWDDLYLAVRAKDTVHPGAVLVNRATIYSDNPADVEPSYSDNASSAATTVRGSAFYLPVALRGQ